MTTNNFVSELDNIFMEWQQKMKTIGDTYYDENGELAFTKDGVIYKNGEKTEITEQKWVNSSKRILFLLKDQHQIRDKGKPFWPEDIRYWLKDGENDKGDALKQKKENRELGNRFFKHLANIFWGLSKADLQNDWEYDEVVKCEYEVKEFFNAQPFALVECKKQPGDGTLDDKILIHHLNEYGDLLIREIEILEPNMIICTSPHIYNFINNAYQKQYPNDGLKRIDEKKHNSIRFHPKTQTLIFCSYHPSSFGKYGGKFNYDSVMDHYRTFLKSIYNL